MTPQEKVPYHQIHPLKLLTEISAEPISLYLIWKRKLVAGLLVLFPDLVVSLLIMRWVDLEPYKHSAFGAYLRTYMTPSVVALRVVGTIITHVGAWYQQACPATSWPRTGPCGLVPGCTLAKTASRSESKEKRS